MRKKVFVCDLSKLQQTGCYGWDTQIDGVKQQYFLILKHGKIYSYVNSCPHTGINLEWVPHQFLDSQNEFIQCATHGALFNISDGKCVHGPCIGDHLGTVDNTIENEKVYLFL